MAANEFGSQDAKKIIKYHVSLINWLKSTRELAGLYKKDVLEASNKLLSQEIMGILRSIPVEELNRDKRGIRVKALRDHNYCTIADLYVTSVYHISLIKGISEDSAYTIKRLVREFADQASREAKIKLSFDDQNKVATDLIKALSIYKNSRGNLEICNNLLENYQAKIEKAISELSPATNVLKWLFTSKSKKNIAIEAYEKLNSDEIYDYCSQVKQQLSYFRDNTQISDFEA